MNSNSQSRRSIAQARTFLFVPANRVERIAKAQQSRADCVIADLEDAVGPEDKNTARDLLVAWLDANPQSSLLVRINALGTGWHDEDVKACRHPGVAGVVLPKAETAADVAAVRHLTGKDVLPIIETAAGIHQVVAIAAAEGCGRLLFGKLDLAVELNLDPAEDDPEERVFLHFRPQLVLASRLAGLPPPVDGVFTALADPEGLRRYTLRGKRHGYGALLLIHPLQVPIVAAAFAPGADDLAWARRVLAAEAASGGGAVSVDGRMVDAPVIQRARRILDESERYPDM